MALSTEDCIAAIEKHSGGLAAAARENLDRRVEHCPDWDVADLVWHVTNVHWLWSTIAAERLSAPPDESRRPSRPPRDQLVAAFERGAQRLTDVLRAADQTAACWTWAPQQQDVAFITRHQVQEAAVHHWDAANAAGRSVLEIDPDVAVDCVEEFLTFSVSSDDFPAEPPRPPLDGAVWICACATSGKEEPTWLVTDGDRPGTVTWQRVPAGAEAAGLLPAGVPTVGGHADPGAVLLWLYGRTAHPFEGGWSGDGTVLDRFRGLTFTG
jgi:uncharacterized protein (TIGR03083 family)